MSVELQLDEHDIPYDVIWLDIEHTDAKKYFTWDKNHFKSPVEMQNALAAKGHKMVTIVDPHIKRDSSYYVHNELTSKSLYIKKPDGKTDFEGWCWPGSVSYPDFLRKEVRDYWAEQFSLSKYEGSTKNLFTWNDMNEPSIFNGPEVTMHKDMLHLGEEAVEHRDVHNLYGFYVHMATSQGLTQRNEARPFVLTRAYFAGSQRWGAMWTGDNRADWGHLKASMPMLLTQGIAGFPFSGADVGGFFGDPAPELLTRWFQAGAFQPFFRGHAHIDTKRREPWLFGEPYTAAIRAAIRSRYVYLPFIYTVFRESSVNGMPVMRPLFYHYSADSETFALESQFLVGSDLMVRPITEAGATSASVYFPGSEPWYDVVSLMAFVGPQSLVVKAPLEKIPVYQRGGSIVPRRDRARRSSALMVNDPYTLVVALDSRGEAVGSLYVDDGFSFDYQQGGFGLCEFSFSKGKLDGVYKSAKYSTPTTIERIVVLGAQSVPTKALLHIDGSTRELQVLSIRQGSSNAFIVRKPDVRIDQNWSIVLV